MVFLALTSVTSADVPAMTEVSGVPFLRGYPRSGLLAVELVALPLLSRSWRGSPVWAMDVSTESRFHTLESL